MPRVFKTRHFTRWMRKTLLTDAGLCQAVAEMAAGLIDADLGGGVVKKRVALAGAQARRRTHLGGHQQGRPLVLRLRLREQ